MSGDKPGNERGFTVVDEPAAGDAAQAAPTPEEGGLPQVDFSSFCLSLATSALYHLGVIGDPESGEPVEQKNLPVAAQTIDALEMLRQKTAGNLDDEEEKLLDGLLYELRMRYVEAGKAAE